VWRWFQQKRSPRKTSGFALRSAVAASVSSLPSSGKRTRLPCLDKKKREANGIQSREASAPKILWCAPNCRARAMTREVTKAYFVLHVWPPQPTSATLFGRQPELDQGWLTTTQREVWWEGKAGQGRKERPRHRWLHRLTQASVETQLDLLPRLGTYMFSLQGRHCYLCRGVVMLVLFEMVHQECFVVAQRRTPPRRFHVLVNRNVAKIRGESGRSTAVALRNTGHYVPQKQLETNTTNWILPLLYRANHLQSIHVSMRGLTSLVKLLLRKACSRRGTSNDASAILTPRPQARRGRGVARKKKKAKKAERARERASNLYYPIVFAANIVYLLCRGKFAARATRTLTAVAEPCIDYTECYVLVSTCGWGYVDVDVWLRLATVFWYLWPSPLL